MALGQAAELLFRIKADNTDAIKNLKETETGVKGLGSAGELAAAGMGSMVNPAQLALTAVTGLATIAVTAAAGLYKLTIASGEYASAIFDVQEKTGLSAAALSTLKINADNAGSSLETVGSGAAKFAKTLGEAQAGNEKAQQTLKDLGVTSTDLETALGQATKTIYDAAEGTDQLVLSQKAFGKSGGDLIGTIKQMGGDLASATEEAKRLGVVMSDEDLAAADNLGDALGLLGAQAKVAGVAFTADLMPVLTRYFTMASQWYAENKQIVRDWGSTIAMVVGDFARGMVTSFNWIRENATVLRGVLATMTLGISEMVIQAGALIAQYYKARGMNRPSEAQEGSGMAIPQTFAPATTTGSSGTRSGAASSAAAKAKAEAERDLQARIELEERYLKRYEEDYRNTLKAIRAEFAKTGDAAKLVSGANAAAKDFRIATAAGYGRLDDLKPVGGSEGERRLQEDQRFERVRQFNALMKTETDATNELILASAKRTADTRLAIEQQLTQDLIAANRERSAQYVKAEEESWDTIIANAVGNEEEQNRLRGEATNALVAILQNEQRIRLDDLEREKETRRKFIIDNVADQERRFKLLEELDELYKQRALISEEEFQARIEAIKNKYAIPVSGGDAEKKLGFPGLDTIKDALGSLKQAGLDAFGSLAQGFGQMVSSWVLYGNQGENSLKKMVAGVLANVAAMATTYAILSLAAAALATTVWGAALLGGTPAQFLKAAALFGAVAVSAAVGGRAVAGNSFSQQGGGTGASNSQGDGRPQTTLTSGGPVNFEQGRRDLPTWMDGLEKKIEAGIANGLQPVMRVVGYSADLIGEVGAKIRAVPPEQVLMSAASTGDGRKAIHKGLIESLEEGSSATDIWRAMCVYGTGF